MNQEMKNRLLALNPEALVEVIDAICGQMGMDFHFGQDPCDCINNPIFYVYGGPHVGTFTVLNYDPVQHDKPKHNIDMDKEHEHIVRVEAPYCEMCDTLGEAIETGHITAYEVIQSPALKQKPKEMPKWCEFGSFRFVCNNNLKQKQDNGCGCYQDPPCRGCAEEQREQLFLTDHEKDIEELKLKLDILRQERDEAIIHANNVVRESSRLITAKIPSGSCGGYWNAVGSFRLFESKTT